MAAPLTAAKAPGDSEGPDAPNGSRGESSDAPGAFVKTSGVPNAHGTGAGDTHMFGMLPNFGTVSGTGTLPAESTGRKFRNASLNSFDPHLYPFVAVVASVNRPSGSGVGGYGGQLARSFTDNTVGNFMTSAVLPSLLHQDPRYYALRTGGVLHRLAYAATRTVVTRGDDSRRQLNVSELGGNLVAAGLSNAYYGAADRTVTGTLGRWALQVMWDAASNELKEFWPDIRRVLHR